MKNFFEILSNISLPSSGLNWLDLVIIIVLAFYTFEGYSLGFIASLLDLIGFVLSFIIGLKTYSFFSQVIIKLFSIPPGFSNAVGFLIAAFFAEVIIGFILRQIFWSFVWCFIGTCFIRISFDSYYCTSCFCFLKTFGVLLKNRKFSCFK